MKKIKSLLVCLSLMLVVFSSALAVPACAETAVSFVAAASTTEISPRAERTEIHYRTYEGRRQYRIWSLTRNCWLTDWTDLP